MIWNVLDKRDRFRNVTILYGARTPVDLVYKDELEEWTATASVEFHVTVDNSLPGWTGNVGMVPVLFTKTTLRPESTLAYVCGPPIMIKFVVQDLFMRGFQDESVISTLERMMQCGIGKCNHCAHWPPICLPGRAGFQLQADPRTGRVRCGSDMNPLEQLAAWIQGEVVVMGIGNPLRGDDAAGSMVARRIAAPPGVSVIDAQEVPEDYFSLVVGPAARHGRTDR